MVKKILAGALFGLFAVGVSTQVFAQADVNEKRQQLMKGQGAAVKSIRGAIGSKDYATIEAKAKDLMGSSDRIVASFPKGSTTGKTRATAAIWEKPDGFAKNAKALATAASELADAAKAKNDDAIAAKMKTIAATCDTCHKEFRAAKYSE
ncbi:MAG TPA: cytochrome c [Candidatus Binatia bacterium]